MEPEDTQFNSEALDLWKIGKQIEKRKENQNKENFGAMAVMPAWFMKFLKMSRMWLQKYPSQKEAKQKMSGWGSNKVWLFFKESEVEQSLCYNVDEADIKGINLKSKFWTTLDNFGSIEMAKIYFQQSGMIDANFDR